MPWLAQTPLLIFVCSRLHTGLADPCHVCVCVCVKIALHSRPAGLDSSIAEDPLDSVAPETLDSVAPDGLLPLDAMAGTITMACWHDATEEEKNKLQILNLSTQETAFSRSFLIDSIALLTGTLRC